MSKLLIDEHPLQVLPSLAVAIGLQDAIVLQQFHYWLKTSKNIHDDRPWIYNTYEEWAKQFPFWTPEAIRKIVKSLRDKGLVQTRKRSSSSWDKTNFYTIDYGQLERLTAPGLHTEEFTASTGEISGRAGGFHRIEPDGFTASNRTDLPHLYTETTSETTAEIVHGAEAPSLSAKLPSCPHNVLIDLFGKHLPAMPQPKTELWTGAKASAMAARWKWALTATKKSGARYAQTREEALDFFERFFAYVSKSDFLTGRNEKWTRCNLSWLMKADNFAKVLEGHYENESAA